MQQLWSSSRRYQAGNKSTEAWPPPLTLLEVAAGPSRNSSGESWGTGPGICRPEDRRSRSILPEQQVHTAADRNDPGQRYGAVAAEVLQLPHREKKPQMHEVASPSPSDPTLGTDPMEAPGTPQRESTALLMASVCRRRCWDLMGLGPIAHHIPPEGVVP